MPLPLRPRMRRTLALAAALSAVGLASADSARAQDWPTKPIRIISPIGAGSAADILSRIYAEQLSSQLKQRIVVENRPGAGGTIGVTAATKATPDGYTILVHSNGYTIAPAVYPKLPYDPLTDLIPITTLGYFPNVLVVGPQKNIRTLKELVDAARAKPGAMNYASGGVGTPTHLAAERLRLGTGFEVQHIPFKSQPDAMTEVVAGRVDFYFCPIFPALPLIKDGKLTALAVSGSNRAAALPTVPTTRELGFTNADYDFWIGVFLPARTPTDIASKLHQQTVEAMQAPQVRQRLTELSIVPKTMSSAEFSAYIKEQIVADAILAKAAGIAAQ